MKILVILALVLAATNVYADDQEQDQSNELTGGKIIIQEPIPYKKGDAVLQFQDGHRVQQIDYSKNWCLVVLTDPMPADGVILPQTLPVTRAGVAQSQATPETYFEFAATHTSQQVNSIQCGQVTEPDDYPAHLLDKEMDLPWAQKTFGEQAHIGVQDK